MSLQSSTGHLFCSSQFAGQQSCTYMVVSTINSDLGAGSQVIISRNWTGGTDGIVLTYDDGTTNQAQVAWFINGGAGGFESVNLASRPTLGKPAGFYWQSSPTTVRGGFKHLDGSTGWVAAQTADPLPGSLTNNTQSISSNTNGSDQSAQCWRCWDALLTEDELSTEILSDRAVRQRNLVFDFPLDNGSITTWPDYSGNGNTAVTQGGTLSAAPNMPVADVVTQQWDHWNKLTPAVISSLILMGRRLVLHP